MQKPGRDWAPSPVNRGDSATRQEVRLGGPPLGPGGEDVTWPDQVAPRGRKASSTRKIKPQTSNLKRCGRYQPVGPPGSSCDAYVGRVCHCHCGSDCRSRHPVRLVWVNGSFGCRTIAARTRDLILNTLLAVTGTYSIIPVLPWDCNGQPSLQIGLK